MANLGWVSFLHFLFNIFYYYYIKTPTLISDLVNYFENFDRNTYPNILYLRMIIKINRFQIAPTLKQKLSVIIYFQDWVIWSPNLLVVFYEDLVDNPIRELEKMIKYLKMPTNPERINCLSPHVSGNFHRTGQVKVDPFTPDHQSLIGDQRCSTG